MSSCCDDQLGLISVSAALTKMKASLSNSSDSELLPLEASLGRVLAKDIISPINVPPFDNSAMDGYALKYDDIKINSTLPMVGRSFAGEAYDPILKAGQCIRIMTGAPVPKGADCVIMQEQTQVAGKQITFLQQAQLMQNIRKAAEDIQIGETILKKGHRLTVRDLQLIASLGLEKILVSKQLKVAVFSTGDELQTAGCELKPGQIFDSNRLGVISLLKRLDVEIIDFGIVPDDMQSLKNTFIKADVRADVVITSGGVSVGEADYTKDLLEELGEIGFWKLAIKPGKPFAFGKLPNSTFFGLPGNPVSAMVTLHQLAVPAIAHLMGWNRPEPQRLLASVGHKIKKSAGRIDFQRGIYKIDDNGEIVVQTTGQQGSGVFSSLSLANCYIVLEQERSTVQTGEKVWIEPFDALLS